MAYKSSNGRVVVPFVSTDTIEETSGSDGQTTIFSYPSTRYVLLKERNRTWDQVYSHKQYLTARAQGTLQSTYGSSSSFKQEPKWVTLHEMKQGVYWVPALNRYVPGFTRSRTQIPLVFTPFGAEWSSLRDLNALNIAKVSALKRVSDVKSMLLVDLAEAQKTHDMIAGRVKQLATALSQVKKGRFVDAGRTLRLNRRQVKRAIRRAARNLAPNLSRGAKLWLEYRYGWMPLVYSVQDAAKHLAHLMVNPAPRNRILRSHSTYKASRAESLDGRNATRVGNSVNVTRGAVVETETTVRFWVKVAPSSYELAQLNAGSFLNLTEVAWELVPLSFVVDWFIKVGDWLQSLTSLAGLSVTDAGYSVSRLTTTTVVETYAYEGTSGWSGTFEGIPDEVVIKESSYVRYNQAQLEAAAGLLPSFPPVSIKLNGAKAADALSLLWGAARSKFRY